MSGANDEMRVVSFYHKDTGLLSGHQLIASDARAVALNTPADHIAIDGHHDHLSKRVDISTGQIVDYQPPAPSAEHQWNDSSKRWEVAPAVQAKAAARSAALAQISALEAASVRAMREMLLGQAGAAARLRAIDDEIVGLRATATNPPA